ncbi:hypothetical protein BGX33_001805 [Mortierella sp. NVP41]|nr:hypothetical protein BGX33_001805 [Mortierella sp. NVP41]
MPTTVTSDLISRDGTQAAMDPEVEIIYTPYGDNTGSKLKESDSGKQLSDQQVKEARSVPQKPVVLDEATSQPSAEPISTGDPEPTNPIYVYAKMPEPAWHSQATLENDEIVARSQNRVSIKSKAPVLTYSSPSRQVATILNSPGQLTPTCPCRYSTPYHLNQPRLDLLRWHHPHRSAPSCSSRSSSCMNSPL